jgi:hypothetical protein
MRPDLRTLYICQIDHHIGSRLQAVLKPCRCAELTWLLTRLLKPGWFWYSEIDGGSRGKGMGQSFYFTALMIILIPYVLIFLVLLWHEVGPFIKNKLSLRQAG